jgi:hypothetical protein
MPDISRGDAATRGLRIFTCGHSFHAFVAGILVELARTAGIVGHECAGTSMIGGSRALQHWQAADDARRALRLGAVDVLTLSCMTAPDPGIGKFARLAAAHSAEVRVTLQELWLPEDRFPFDPANRTRQSVEQFNDSTLADLRPVHDAYFKVMDDHVDALNAEIGRPALCVVPDAQATLALRERIIAGAVPDLPRQSDLFTDAWGHPASALRLLTGYCHFAVIYRRSPVGLPLPGDLAEVADISEALNRLLQELAWEAVAAHRLSGVRTDSADA